jgi:hypothetical protein
LRNGGESKNICAWCIEIAVILSEFQWGCLLLNVIQVNYPAQITVGINSFHGYAVSAPGIGVKKLKFGNGFVDYNGWVPINGCTQIGL